MKLGVVGLPNVGKSTLFNAITQAKAEIANYPFCTIEPNVGVVAVPDERLDKLAALYDSKKITPTYLKFVDIAGLVKGASRGEGLGNKFLSHIREVDAIVHVVRCFEDADVTHVSDKIDPVADMDTINLELVLADLETVKSRLEKAKALLNKGDKSYASEVGALDKVYAALSEGKPARSVALDAEERAKVNELFLLTAKPVVYAANISESDLGKSEDGLPAVARVRRRAAEEGAQTLVICAKVEEELSSLDDGEKQMFLDSYGIEESGLNRLVKKCYELLGLISYLTAGEKETRAWTVEKGTKAPQARGQNPLRFRERLHTCRGGALPNAARMRQLHKRQGARQGQERGKGLRNQGRRRGAFPFQCLTEEKNGKITCRENGAKRSVSKTSLRLPAAIYSEGAASTL